jgi:hypothetical protein
MLIHIQFSRVTMVAQYDCSTWSIWLQGGCSRGLLGGAAAAQKDCSGGVLSVHNPLTRCSNTACAGLNGSHMVGLKNGVQDHVGMAWVTCAACCWGAHSCFERGASVGCHGLRCVWCVCGARASSRRRGLKRWERVCAQRVAHVCVARAGFFSRHRTPNIRFWAKNRSSVRSKNLILGPVTSVSCCYMSIFRFQLHTFTLVTDRTLTGTMPWHDPGTMHVVNVNL